MLKDPAFEEENQLETGDFPHVSTEIIQKTSHFELFSQAPGLQERTFLLLRHLFVASPLGLQLARRRALHGEAYRLDEAPAAAAPGPGWPPEDLERIEDCLQAEENRVFDARPGGIEEDQVS